MKNGACAVGSFSASSTIHDVALTVPESTDHVLSGTVSATSRIVKLGENEPAAHAPFFIADERKTANGKVRVARVQAPLPWHQLAE